MIVVKISVSKLFPSIPDDCVPIHLETGIAARAYTNVVSAVVKKVSNNYGVKLRLSMELLDFLHRSVDC
jgi:hypothetical protein